MADTAQLYLIAPSGGEAFALTRGEEEVHSFAWSADGRALYFATRTPWSKAQKDAYRKDWKDVNQYRAAERGDQIFRIALADAIQHHQAESASAPDEGSDNESEPTPLAYPLSSISWRVQQMEVSPDGRRLAFVTESVSERQEKIEEFEIYTLDLTSSARDQAPRQLTHNQAQERELRWDKDSRHVFFNVEIGSVEGKYADVQPRVYSVDADTGSTERWASGFGGEITHYAFLNSGQLLAAGRVGTEVQLYSQAKASTAFSPQAGWPGTYELLDAAVQSAKVAFVHSTLEKPTEVYVAESIDKLQQATPITSFNRLFTERELPKGKPYRWTADDGTTIEGMLIYPPGKFEAKHLPMFTLIHGGPIDADGNHFEADWYQWDRLAANQGWLVFEPNYRGSSGYGDEFVKGIVPHLVSRPGKDILEGVDALAKDGSADVEHLAVGGYSYGGYMTNWLITQSTRWKAAVTGAGAVEHVANWGNDDTTFDDAYYLGGLPWEAPQRYQEEGAIFQMNRVRTPTHLVAGADDIRVAVAEDYLLDHALHNLGVPSSLLVFPGEGHSLDKNPWHGKIKVREELKWLKQYGGIQAEP
jgi:dipeptidyl aminopeptidase/acylaminoacyl peptidase